MSAYAVVIAARMGSSRLPGKALADYGAGPNLNQIVHRWQQSDRDPAIIVATSSCTIDSPINDLCLSLSVPCFRGDLHNVLGRMDGALREFAPNARYVARALADNPLVDVPLADWRLDVLAETGADGLWYGDHERITYAGTTDVWSRPAWDRIVTDSTGCQLLHPGLHWWENISHYQALQIPLPRREYLAPFRTELDTPADLAMLRALWGAWCQPDTLPTLWALGYLRTHPAVAALNSAVPTATQTRATFRNHEKAWSCPDCHQRGGSIVAGNLRMFCPRCGKRLTFYAHAPARDGR